MRCRDFFYFTTDIGKSEVFSCGSKFAEFIEFVPVKPINILLMESGFWKGKYHNITGFEYVDIENMKDLISDNVYSYGNFCWMDFEDKNSIDTITPVELSELLYMRHKFKPLNSPFFSRLNNNYVYFAHDDDYWTRIYMKNIHDYKKVIEGKILKALKGRKREIAPIPEDIIEVIFHGSKEGVLIDFPNIYLSNGKTGVRIYKIGRYSSYDQVRKVFERKQYYCNTDVTLEYSNKKWTIYGEWK